MSQIQRRRARFEADQQHFFWSTEVVTKTDRIEVGGYWHDKIHSGQASKLFFVRAATFNDLNRPRSAKQRIDNETAWFMSNEAEMRLGGFVAADHCGVQAVLTRCGTTLEERRRQKLVSCADKLQVELESLRALCKASEPPRIPSFVEAKSLLRSKFDALQERLEYAYQYDGTVSATVAKHFSNAYRKLIQLTPVYGPIDQAIQDNVFVQHLTRI